MHDDLIQDIRRRRAVLWTNPKLASSKEVLGDLPLSMDDVLDAANRLKYFAPLLKCLFSELIATDGIIDSPLTSASKLRTIIDDNQVNCADIFLKRDDALPVAGSIKARGGIYEVLLHAEYLGKSHCLIPPSLSAVDSPNLMALTSQKAKGVFSRHTIAAGSTGNLGLSIGVAARALNFKAVVHMSSDAKEWKKERLKNLGVEVVEHDGDYATAVAAGRANAKHDPKLYFVDDECSKALFLGYGVAALRLKDQLADNSIIVDENHPLFVYLPCGVGGAAGGICFGLKHIFGDNVHCFFAEPMEAPCMMLRLGNADANNTVYEYGLNNKTDADGLAVAKASDFVANMMKNIVSGVFTVSDEDMYRWVYRIKQTEGIAIEPSAAAGLEGFNFLCSSSAGRNYLRQKNLIEKMSQSTHIFWLTGGSLVPKNEYEEFYERGHFLDALRTSR